MRTLAWGIDIATYSASVNFVRIVVYLNDWEQSQPSCVEFKDHHPESETVTQNYRG
jgi:hypothetical protein